MKPFFTKVVVKRLAVNLLLFVLVILAYKTIMDAGRIFGMLGRAFKVISPFFYGFLLAYVLNIPCNGIQSLCAGTGSKFLRKHKKGLSIACVYLLLLLLLFFVLRMIIPAIYESILLFINNFDTYYRRAQEVLDHINSITSLGLDLNIERFVDPIKTFNLASVSTSFQALLGVSSGIFNGFLMLISSVYVLIEKESFKAYLTRMINAFLSQKASALVIRYSARLSLSFRQYLYTQTIDGCVVGSLAGIELALMGSQYALLLGILMGFLNYIPYFGSIIGTVVAVLVVTFTQSLPMGLLALVILLVTQQIDGNIIQPKLMENSLSISPLLVIVSVTVGGAIGGALGMIAAIPLIDVLLDVLEDMLAYLESRRSRKANQAPQRDSLE